MVTDGECGNCGGHGGGGSESDNDNESVVVVVVVVCLCVHVSVIFNDEKIKKNYTQVLL